MQRLFFLLTIFTSIILSSMKAYASEVSDLVAKYETEVEAEIKAQGKTNEDKYYIYALFARELLGLKEYSLAKKYYKKALESGEKASILDMNEVHYNMLFIRYKEGADKDELRELFSIVKRTVKNQDNPQVKAALAYWDKVINGEYEKEIDKSLVQSYYGNAYSLVKLENLIKNKKYSEALTLMPSNIKDVNMVLKIHHDVLTSLVFSKKKELLCSEKLKRYPRSPATTMQICRYLKGEREYITLDSIKKQMQREDFKYDYLLSALKDIQSNKASPSKGPSKGKSDE